MKTQKWCFAFLLVGVVLIFLTGRMVFAREAIFSYPGGQTVENQQENTVEEKEQGTSAEEGENAHPPEGGQEKANEKTEVTEEQVPLEVLSWTWRGDALEWSEENKRWEMILPGASKEQIVSRDLLKTYLPGTIRAEMNAGEQEIALNWELDDWPENAYEGEYSLKASLPEGYVMREEAGVLEVTVRLGGAVTKDSQAIYDDLSFEGVSPKGTTINVFDYWQWGRDDSDNKDHNPIRVGINGSRRSGNEDHLLLFRQANKNTYNPVNQWTKSAKPRQGIVKSVLENGFPETTQNEESLAYLFDRNEDVGNTKNEGQGGKKAFMNVGGLLQVDNEGYYYYDCQKNYAYFNEETERFQLYNTPGIKMTSEGNQNTYGQFFPFTKPGVVFNRDNDNKLVPKEIGPRDAQLNHYFGLSMTTRFVQQDGGEINQNGSKKPVTYEFSGDDDVWIFIDDVLVADLGGIHDAAAVEIDFSTGEVVINEGKNHEGNSIEQRSTLKEQFEDAGRDKRVKWSGNTFADGSYHTLKFFYLERGNSESNMSLKYNLVTVPESDIIKVDQLGDPVAGAAFTLYAANENYEIQQEGDKDQVIATGTTDEDGTFVLVDEEGFIISLKDLKDRDIDHFILRETKVPEGYRFAGDVKLYLETGGNEDTLLLCANPWESGSYASPKLTVSTDPAVTDTNEKPHDLKDGTMFAVVLKYKGDGNKGISDSKNWQVVSGDPMTGWKTAPADMANVLTAARENPYVFELDSSGSYKAELENMQGDIMTYYFMLPENERNEKVKYVVNYYYTTADSLESANEKDTVRLKNDEGDYTREFSARLYVPNVQNRLLVQKFADDGVTPVTGATFALYEGENIKVDSDGSYTINEGSRPYCEVTTADLSKENGDGINLDGGGVLPTKAQVEQGKRGLITGKTYYLVETNVPMGYKVNPKAVQVTVDNSGIYADAGDKMDGISVARGVGSVVKSMIQFVAEDEIDTTLHDIKVKQQTSDTYPVGEGGWNLQNEPELHLQYDAEGAALEYKPTEFSDGTKTSDRLVVDQGWSKLKIQQCLEHSNREYKQNLGETDLTNLFSRTAIVQVTNQRVGSLKIEKKVTGDFLPTDSAFTFNLTLKDKAGNLLDVEGEKHCGGGKTEKVQIEKGSGTFTLKAGEWVSFTELPADAEFTVNEVEVPAAYTPSITVDGQSADVQENGVTGTIAQSTEPKPETTVTFTNAYNGDVQTAIQGQKTLLGRNLEGRDVFTFVLEPGDEATTQAIEHKKVLLEDTSKEVKGAGTQSTQSFEFSPITFKTEGRYTFSVKEKLPDNPTGNRDEQYVYDSHIAKVQVDVKRNPKTQKLQATLIYDNTAALTEDDRESSKAAFTNTIMADFQFTKINREGMPLSGATFGLYQLECQNAEHNHDQGKIEVNADGEPIGSSAECWKQVDKVSSEVSGVVSFSKLPVDGTYRLVELKAPDGYGLPNGQWKVVYEQTGFTIPEGSAVGNPPAVYEKNGIYKILNEPPVELPLSGSQGTTMFLSVGAVLMLAGMTGILLFKNRRKS